jgi:hypothetical protein
MVFPILTAVHLLLVQAVMVAILHLELTANRHALIPVQITMVMVTVIRVIPHVEMVQRQTAMTEMRP